MANISIADERSTEINEGTVDANSSVTDLSIKQTNVTPYKTVNNFNNLKSF